MRNDSFRIRSYGLAMTNHTALQPFTIAIPDHDMEDLRDRLRRTRWPQPLPGVGWERGVPVEYLRELASYWRDGFDWREQERQLNAIPQFTTTIEDQRIHFLHVRSPEPDALPLILTHGWPSSPVEFLQVIGPLTDPAAHGANPADAFHLVIPSLPGYGFSTPVNEPGWGNLFRVAQAWAELMDRLGYQRYAVHGTDVGSGIADLLAMIAPHRVVGTHLSGTVAAMPFGPPLQTEGLAAADRERAERFNAFRSEGIGYLHIQATRPATLAYSLGDSPVGQLAWIVDRVWATTDSAKQLPEDAVDRDQMLTNVSIYWFTCSGASSANGTYEGMQAWRQMAASQPEAPATGADQQAGPPKGVAVFAADTTIRSVMDPDGRIEHWSQFDRGGHFPAMETPDLLTNDLREFFRKHR
jgi:pimeloyl-ACP methyl ester carboxylesterase